MPNFYYQNTHEKNLINHVNFFLYLSEILIYTSLFFLCTYTAGIRSLAPHPCTGLSSTKAQKVEIRANGGAEEGLLEKATTKIEVGNLTPDYFRLATTLVFCQKTDNGRGRIVLYLPI